MVGPRKRDEQCLLTEDIRVRRIDEHHLHLRKFMALLTNISDLTLSSEVAP
jgi:hypothetical protein